MVRKVLNSIEILIVFVFPIPFPILLLIFTLPVSACILENGLINSVCLTPLLLH